MLDERLAGAWALTDAPADRLVDRAPSAIVIQSDGRMRRLWRYRFRAGRGENAGITLPSGILPSDEDLFFISEMASRLVASETEGKPLSEADIRQIRELRAGPCREVFEECREQLARQAMIGATMKIFGALPQGESDNDALCDLYRIGGAGPGLAGYWSWGQSMDDAMEYWFGGENLLRCYGPVFVSASVDDFDDPFDMCEGEMICGCSETWAEGYGLDASGLRFVQGSFRRGGVAMERERRTTDGEDSDDRAVEVEVPATTPASPPRPDHVWHYRAFPGVNAVEGDLLIADAEDAPRFVATKDTELIIGRHASDLSEARQYRYELRGDALSLATEEGVETYRRIPDPFTGNACPDIPLADRWIG